ncbi:hypothetical protein KM043_003141 [Ampulex compressa]|nr:hypothetical protein KM043_003141 [Ampulex compressa]
MEARRGRGAAARGTTRSVARNLRNVARFCIDALKAIYVGDVGDVVDRSAIGLGLALHRTFRAGRERPLERAAMGNLQSDGKRRANKRPRSGGAAPAGGASSEDLDREEAREPPAEAGPSREPAASLAFDRVRAQCHGKRQAPKPPGGRAGAQGALEPCHRASETGRGSAPKDDAPEEGASDAPTTRARPQPQPQPQPPPPPPPPPLLVTDSWRLANKSLVVTEISSAMPLSQESSSDSVFTDPEELLVLASPDISTEERDRPEARAEEEREEREGRPMTSSAAEPPRDAPPAPPSKGSGSDADGKSYRALPPPMQHGGVEGRRHSSGEVPTKNGTAPPRAAESSRPSRAPPERTPGRSVVAAARQQEDATLPEESEGRDLLEWLMSAPIQDSSTRLTEEQLARFSGNLRSRLNALGILLLPLEEAEARESGRVLASADHAGKPVGTLDARETSDESPAAATGREPAREAARGMAEEERAPRLRHREARADKSTQTSPRSSVNLEAPAPPPPPPPAAGPTGPNPLPAPPVGGWNPPSRASMRKEALCPNVPMKPLYWTRILVPAPPPPASSQSTSSLDAPHPSQQVPLWMDLEEEKNLDMKEFADLFSRQVAQRRPAKREEEQGARKASKAQPAKILDSKRSKTVGILEKSLHVDFSEVENAVYNLDTSVLSLEALQQIYEIRPTGKELEDIATYEKAHPEVPLDRPEIFLKRLSGIKHFAERIACLVFQSEFQDAISSVSSKLTNLRTTCDFLKNSSSLKRVLALILTLGNYMNGGNRTRGQADGFGLEILGKLRDVKSNAPGVTLLHYVVRARLAQEAEDASFEEPLPLPVPEPADVEAASSINFEDIERELERLRTRLRACTEKCELVAEADPETAGPFKEKMDAFFASAVTELANEKEALQEARNKFKAVMQFYQYVPKGATLDTADPNAFFLLWLAFSRDFKDIWKKEQQRLRKERMEATRKKFESKSNVERLKLNATGLKARLQKLSNK